MENDCAGQPTGEQFKTHFEDLLKQSHTENLVNEDLENVSYMPVLDDPFASSGLDQALNGMKVKKSTGIMSRYYKQSTSVVAHVFIDFLI